VRIKITGALDVRDGYGYITQSLALALDALGHEVWVSPVSIWQSEEQLNPRMNELLAPNEPEFELIIMYPVHGFSELHERAAIMTMYEAHRCPIEWVKKLNRMKIPVLCPSYFVRNMFKDSGVKNRLEVLNLGVDSVLYRKVSRSYPKDIPLKFLTMGKMEPRKNLETTVRCFLKAFPTENVELIIKTRERFLSRDVKIAANRDTRIKIIEKTITENELVKLYSYCHAFVYPSRGEGFAFPPRNAIATGMPTIVTNWSALAEIPGTIKLPVLKLSAMHPCGFSYGDHDKMHMADVDEGCLIGFMQDLYNSEYLYNRWAKIAYDTRQDTWEECAKNLIDMIEGGL
jgi:glycosyltransferase involved in cell wall biosynthesis